MPHPKSQTIEPNGVIVQAIVNLRETFYFVFYNVAFGFHRIKGSNSVSKLVNILFHFLFKTIEFLDTWFSRPYSPREVMKKTGAHFTLATNKSRKNRSAGPGKDQQNIQGWQLQMTKYINISILVLILIGVTMPNSNSRAETQNVSLQLLWKHQFESAGFYMAKEKVIFKR